MEPSQSSKGCLIAIEEIATVLYACRDCGSFTCDDTTVTANSAADAVEAIDAILRNHSLVPDEAAHSDACQYH